MHPPATSHSPQASATGNAPLKYDMIVIGAGSGGLSVALPMHTFGFKVLLIDKSGHAIGGDCLNDGCVPSKALIHAARKVHQARQAAAFGLEVRGEADMGKVAAYVKSRQAIIREHENAQFFREMGLDVALGTAQFVAPDQIGVGGQVYEGKNIVIATGSRPRKLTIPGAERVDYLTNQSIFDLTRLPENLLVIGGGPIGIEMAQAFRRLGAAVTVVHSKAMILDKEAPEIARVLHERLRGEGIRFYLGAEAVAFPDPNHLRVRTGDGPEAILPFDAVLVAIGRELNWEDLELAKGEIETEGRGGQVDSHGLTST